MIRRQVSAALMALDGFTGRTLGQRVRCELDGVPLTRPVWKRDGWLVLTNLSPGEHRLTLRCPGFQDATLSLSGGARQEYSVILSPGPGYAFPPGTAFLSLTVSAPPDAEAEIFAGIAVPRPLKLMKEARAGESAVQMLLRGPAPSPGWFLFNGKTPEAVFLRRVSVKGDAETASPLTETHFRGEALIPTQRFSVKAGEAVRMPFREAGTAVLFCGGKLKTVELRTGAETRLEWNLEE